MRQIRETLRLHLQAGLSYNEVGRALKISKSVVGKYVSLARVAGVDWDAGPDPQRRGTGGPAVPPGGAALAATSSRPTSRVVHQELKRPGVTLMLLWEEYATGNPLAYKYTSFCVKYREFAKAPAALDAPDPHRRREAVRRLRRPDRAHRRRRHRRDHARPRSSWPRWARRTTPTPAPPPRQTTADWIGAQVQALEFIGGVPRLIVPDQTRALIKTPDRYDPEPNRTYEEFAAHYGCAVLAARPAHPRDKPKVEGSVLLVAALDPGAAAQPPLLQPGRAQRGHRRAAGRPEPPPLQEAARLPAQRLRGAGRAGAAAAAAPALCHRPLEDAPRSTSTTTSSSRATTTACRTGWSAPEVDVRVTGQLLECFASNQRVAGHAVSTVRGGFTTTPEHMPASHRAHLEWTPAKLIAWGQRIGVSTAAVVTWQLEHRPHPEQGYRACLGLLAPGAPVLAPSGWRPPAPAPWPSARPTCAASPTSSSAAWTASPSLFAADGQPRHRARQRARARLLPLTSTDPPTTKETHRC